MPRSWLGRELAVRGDVEPPHLGGDGNNMGKSWEKHGVLLEVLPVFAILVNLDVTYIYIYIHILTYVNQYISLGKPWGNGVITYLDVHPTLGFIIHIYIYKLYYIILYYMI